MYVHGSEERLIQAARGDQRKKSVGIEFPDGKVIKSLQEGQTCTYLGILEADKFLEEKFLKEYIRRLRKVLKSKLNGGNLVFGVNTWAVSLLKYSAVFFSWRKSELHAIDRKNRKLFTVYGASDVSRVFWGRLVTSWSPPSPFPTTMVGRNF